MMENDQEGKKVKLPKKKKFKMALTKKCVVHPGELERNCSF